MTSEILFIERRIMEENLNLKGKTVILTRAQNQQIKSRRLFESYGARVLDLPALIIGPPTEWDLLDTTLEELDRFDWLIFSSANGVEAVQQRLLRKNKTLSNLPSTLKLAVVGRKTANSLDQFGIKADFVPPDFVADSLIANFPLPVRGLRMLLPRVESGGRAILAESFSEEGANIVEVAAYESTCPENMPQKTLEALCNFEVDAITFTSSKTVLHVTELMKKYFGNQWQKKLNTVKLISIGPQTTISCEKYFQRVDKEALPHTIDGLIQACIDCIN